MNQPGPFGATLLLLAFVGGASPSPAPAGDATEFALDTAFTYQGKLQRRGAPAEGRFDITFELYDAPEGGISLGRIDDFDVPIRQGAFAAELDFGHSVYSGNPVWLEIQVRPAGEGAYTALDPRHRLTGEGVSTCVVDSDVLIHGTLDIDPVGAEVALDIACCNEATLEGGGQVVLGGFLQSLGIDNNEIQSRGLGGAAAFWINPHGGNVGIGVSGSPQAPLQMPAGPDAEPDTGGSLVLGPVTGTNLAFDNNEIMARNNGATSTLYLNNDGGDVVVGGHLDYGLVRVVARDDGPHWTVQCPAGTYIVSGGCSCQGDEDLVRSFPQGSTRWWCSCTGSASDPNHEGFAVCARVRY